MAVTFAKARTRYIGCVRVVNLEVRTTGSSDTISGLPVRAASTTAHRAFAITRTPLTDGSENANIRPSAVTAEKLDCLIDGGANGDQFTMRVYSW